MVKEIESTGGRALAVKADCTEYSSAKNLVDATVEASGGKIDIIVNNAGCGDDVLLDQVDEETFDMTIYTNLRFPLTLIKEAVPFLQQGSRIVNVGSVASKLGKWASVLTLLGIPSLVKQRPVANERLWDIQSALTVICTPPVRQHLRP